MVLKCNDCTLILLIVASVVICLEPVTSFCTGLVFPAFIVFDTSWKYIEVRLWVSSFIFANLVAFTIVGLIAYFNAQTPENEETVDSINPAEDSKNIIKTEEDLDQLLELAEKELKEAEKRLKESESACKFEMGQEVECRDRLNPTWRTGYVTSTEPLEVKPKSWGFPKPWDEVRAKKADTETKPKTFHENLVVEPSYESSEPPLPKSISLVGHLQKVEEKEMEYKADATSNFDIPKKTVQKQNSEIIEKAESSALEAESVKKEKECLETKVEHEPLNEASFPKEAKKPVFKLSQVEDCEEWIVLDGEQIESEYKTRFTKKIRQRRSTGS